MLTRSAAKKAEADGVNLTHDAVATEGTRIVITPSATGEGVHTRWIRTTVERGATENIADDSSTFSHGSDDVDLRFVTPGPQQTYEPVSALRTPRKTQRSPRIEKATPTQQRVSRGIPKQLVFEDESLSEESLRERDARDEIAEKQYKKLMDGKKENDRLLSQGMKGVRSKQHGDLGSPFGGPSSEGNGIIPRLDHARFIPGSPVQNQHVGQPRHYLHTPRHQPSTPQRLGPHGTHLILDNDDGFDTLMDIERIPPRLGPHGTHLLGPHGTELLDVTPRRRARLGPHGTELI